MFYWRSRRTDTFHPARGVSSAVGAGPRPARRASLPFMATFRRGDPRGRPPQHTPRPLGLYLRTGCDPTLPHRRRRGQSRNRGRTLCAPTKNVIRCGGRMISAPTQHVVPIPRADNIRPYEKRESDCGRAHSVRPYKKRYPVRRAGAHCAPRRKMLPGAADGGQLPPKPNPLRSAPF